MYTEVTLTNMILLAIWMLFIGKFILTKKRVYFYHVIYECKGYDNKRFINGIVSFSSSPDYEMLKEYFDKIIRVEGGADIKNIEIITFNRI